MLRRRIEDVPASYPRFERKAFFVNDLIAIDVDDNDAFRDKATNEKGAFPLGKLSAVIISHS